VTGKDLSTIAGILGPRNADGSLPNVDFLRLKKGSRAIDKGEDIGFPFAGEAPDLGAFEYGLSSSSAATSSSSSASTIVAPLALPENVQGEVMVFDLQGRYLGMLLSEQLRDKSLAETLRAKFRTPGVYLVRFGQKKYFVLAL